MAGLTGDIERFLKQMLGETEDGVLEIGRNELADHFQCAPSQINYVLQTRFTPYKGYYIESRRGGSGFIKITKLTVGANTRIREILQEGIGTEMTLEEANSLIQYLVDEELMTEREGLLTKHAVCNLALEEISPKKRNVVRADILRNILLVFFR